jgi:hypothetical protein
MFFEALKMAQTIRLWKEDVAKCPKLSTWVLNLVPFHPIWGIDELGQVRKKGSLVVGF